MVSRQNTLLGLSPRQGAKALQLSCLHIFTFLKFTGRLTQLCKLATLKFLSTIQNNSLSSQIKKNSGGFLFWCPPFTSAPNSGTYITLSLALPWRWQDIYHVWLWSAVTSHTPKHDKDNDADASTLSFRSEDSRWCWFCASQYLYNLSTTI